MPKGYSYIRFSTKKQQHGDSLDRQLMKSREYCKKNNIEFSDKSYQDLGISAFKDKTRASLEDLFSAIETSIIKEGDYIILEALDRLSRKGYRSTTDLVNKIIDKGVKLVILEENFVLEKKNEDDLAHIIRIAVAADLGHKESQQKSARVQSAKDAAKTKARAGEFISKRLRYWLKKNETNDGYEFNENIDVIRLIIELRQKGDGFHKIAIYLNTKTLFKPRKAEKWADQTIRDFITSPSLYGAYQIGCVKDGKFIGNIDSLVLDYFPKVVSYSEWKKLQPNVINRVGGNSKHNHIVGVMRCGSCGSAMTKKISKRTTKTTTHKYKNWLCVRSKSGGCKQQLTIKDLDEVVFYIFKNIILQTEVEQPETEMLEHEIDRLVTKEKETITLNTSGEYEPKIVARLLEGISKELNKKRKEYDEITRNFHTIQQNDIDKLSNYQSAPIEYNLKLRLIVEKIVVTVESKNYFKVFAYLRNGHRAGVHVSRKSERSDYNYIFYGTDSSLKSPELFDWEDNSILNDESHLIYGQE
jgi:DNA invertase Pin-like site-specific DNA recombinase